MSLRDLAQQQTDLQRSSSDPSAFRQFPLGPQSLRQSHPQRIRLRLSTDIVDTYKSINSDFKYNQSENPKRVLTQPSKPMHNDGYDNQESDLILHVNDCIGDKDSKYKVLDLLGSGTFGQVVKCSHQVSGKVVAVKVIKNKTAYFNQSMVEVTILEMLNHKYDPKDQKNIIRLLGTFIYKKHLCLIFEPLSMNLYELIKQNKFKGLSLNLIQLFTKQILDALAVLNEANIIHCDLKPENILLKDLETPQIKVIDFGSACHDRQTVYTYIQSRFYRSPEVLLGLQYTSSIDIWSLGCICAELFLGLPIFPGQSEYDQVSRIVECLGLPPTYMLEFGKYSKNFFQKQQFQNQPVQWQLKSLDQYNMEKGLFEKPGKKYFKQTLLSDLILNYPLSKKALRSQEDTDKEMNHRACFVDFLRGLLALNPLERWLAPQAMLHPFVTGQPWTGPFTPPLTVVKKFNSNEQANPISSKNGSSENLRQPKYEPPYKVRARSNTILSSQFNVPQQLQKATSNVAQQSTGQRFPVTTRRPSFVQRDSPRLSQGSSTSSLGSADPLHEFKRMSHAADHTKTQQLLQQGSSSHQNLGQSNVRLSSSLTNSPSLHFGSPGSHSKHQNSPLRGVAYNGSLQDFKPTNLSQESIPEYTQMNSEFGQLKLQQSQQQPLFNGSVSLSQEHLDQPSPLSKDNNQSPRINKRLSNIRFGA